MYKEILKGFELRYNLHLGNYTSKRKVNENN